jgi:hypothetical protein
MFALVLQGTGFLVSLYTWCDPNMPIVYLLFISLIPSLGMGVFVTTLTNYV